MKRIFKLTSAVKSGFGFGITSGIITTLGLMVGLTAGTSSKLAVIGGVITIAIADGFSDALGMHISRESEKSSSEDIWSSSFSTLASKIIVALTFVIPVVVFDLYFAIFASILWGFSILAIFSYYLARDRKESAVKSINEHLGIAVIVIAVSYFVGQFVSKTFS